LWIDPERRIYAVLLTNRVHPTRSNVAIQGVRRAFHDAVIGSLT
jgi:CubicO group peptidase (beta-lactamase class C family)